MDFPKAKWGRGGTAAGGDLTSLTSALVGPTGVNLVFSARGGLVRYYPPYNIIDSFAGFFFLIFVDFFFKVDVETASSSRGFRSCVVP